MNERFIEDYGLPPGTRIGSPNAKGFRQVVINREHICNVRRDATATVHGCPLSHAWFGYSLAGKRLTGWHTEAGAAALAALSQLGRYQ